MNQSQQPTFLLASLLPMFLAMLAVAAIILLIAPRKGKSRALAFLAIIPLGNMIVVIWLLSLTDKAVLDALEELKRKIT